MFTEPDKWLPSGASLEGVTKEEAAKSLGVTLDAF
jgi:hypothetical protein